MSRSVLVVDDALFARTVIREILQASGFYSLAGEATDGREAVEMYEKRRPDIVTMDIVMPRMDGIAATREITRSGGAGVRIIVCSAMGQEALIHEALDAGANDFIVKPITSEKLLPALDRQSEREVPPWT